MGTTLYFLKKKKKNRWSSVSCPARPQRDMQRVVSCWSGSGRFPMAFWLQPSHPSLEWRRTSLMVGKYRGADISLQDSNLLLGVLGPLTKFPRFTSHLSLLLPPPPFWNSSLPGCAWATLQCFTVWRTPAGQHGWWNKPTDLVSFFF